MHERAGDVALRHNFFAAAAEHYQDALAIENEAFDRTPIYQKLTYALFLSDDPGAAKPWYDRILASSLGNLAARKSTVETLLSISQQLWLECKTLEALPISRRAIEIAETLNELKLKAAAYSNLCNKLLIVGQYDEAKAVCDKLRVIRNKPLWLRRSYNEYQGTLTAVFGSASECHRYFERALSANDDNVYISALTSQAYWYCAMRLGEIDRAEACIERVLLVARQYRLAWYIPYALLLYADTLRKAGRYSAARAYLHEAVGSPAAAPLLTVTFAEVGIPLALTINDEEVLTRCANPEVLRLAFQAGEPDTIAPVAAAFAQLYHARGMENEARSLVHRGLEVTTQFFSQPQIIFAVARFGEESDCRAARQLLQRHRIMRQNSGYGYACRELFEAYVAQRNGFLDASYEHAGKAVQHFEATHWHGLADEARSLLPAGALARTVSRDVQPPFTTVHSNLTEREREIAGFVLQGLTNRDIAAELAITENTVEKHMTSIMNRLNIRSRHQLAAAIEHPTPEVT